MKFKTLKGQIETFRKLNINSLRMHFEIKTCIFSNFRKFIFWNYHLKHDFESSS